MTKTTFFSAMCAVTLSLWAIPTAAQVPREIPVQGYATDTVGLPLVGERTIELALYDASGEAEPLFRERQTVLMEGGYFEVYLGRGAALDIGIFREHQDLLLGLTIDGEELLPRTELATVPFAAYCEHAGSVPFGGIADLPAGIADGDQDTTYSAGEGLTLTETTFSVDPSEIQRRVSGSCSTGMIVSIAEDGSVRCRSPELHCIEEGGTGPDATCPAGYTVTGGSCYVVSGLFGYRGVRYSRMEGNGWRCGAEDGVARAWARCCRVR